MSLKIKIPTPYIVVTNTCFDTYYNVVTPSFLFVMKTLRYIIVLIGLHDSIIITTEFDML